MPMSLFNQSNNETTSPHIVDFLLDVQGSPVRILRAHIIVQSASQTIGQTSHTFEHRLLSLCGMCPHSIEVTVLHDPLSRALLDRQPQQMRTR